MSEEAKKTRTVEEIQQEYTQLCCKAGHTQYQISGLEKDLEMINSSLRELNFEAAAASAAKAAAEAPKEEKASA